MNNTNLSPGSFCLFYELIGKNDGTHIKKTNAMQNFYNPVYFPLCIDFFLCGEYKVTVFNEIFQL